MTIMEQPSEKRKLERRLFTSPVLIEMSDQENGTFIPVQLPGEGVDISSSGVGIRTNKYIHQGQVVKMFLPLGSHDTLIPSFSEVRWVAGSGNSFRLGLRFIS